MPALNRLNMGILEPPLDCFQSMGALDPGPRVNMVYLLVDLDALRALLGGDALEEEGRVQVYRVAQRQRPQVVLHNKSHGGTRLRMLAIRLDSASIPTRGPSSYPK